MRKAKLRMGGARKPIMDLKTGELVHVQYYGVLKVVDKFMWEGQLVYTLQETNKAKPSAWAFYAKELDKHLA